MAQALYDTADDDTHNGEEEHGKERQLPRYANHQAKVADDKEGVAECHLQGVGDAVLHDHNILGYLRHNIALALLAEVSYIHRDNLREHLITHTAQGRNTQSLNGHRSGIAEGVAEQVHRHRYATKHRKEAHMVEIRAEGIGIYPAEQGIEAIGIERYFGEGVDGHKLEVCLKHSVEDGDNHRIVEGVEHRVQRCEDKVGYGIST